MAPYPRWLVEAQRAPRHVAKYIVNREYRTLSGILKVPRYRRFTTDLLGPPLTAVDSGSFVNSYAEIFQRELYRFPCDHARPRIIDCGANIGLSVLYFKRLFPLSLITAFEADAAICDVLAHNVEAFGLSDVTIHNRAVWTDETVLEFEADGADAGRIASVPSQLEPRDYLSTETIDLLKMDIEGAEIAVLSDCAPSLGSVRRLFVEYHSFDGQAQDLHVLFGLLQDCGFRVYVEGVNGRAHPFAARRDLLGMDLQLNVFATRPGAGA
jgi:FkbM family methyltransferase